MVYKQQPTVETANLWMKFFGSKDSNWANHGSETHTALSWCSYYRAIYLFGDNKTVEDSLFVPDQDYICLINAILTLCLRSYSSQAPLFHLYSRLTKPSRYPQ